MQALQDAAEEMRAEIAVACLPGSFIGPGQPIAYVMKGTSELDERAGKGMADAFLIEPERSYEEDPRFGLIVLSEIAARALSPAVNDPGTAITILGSFIRLLAFWVEPAEDGATAEIRYDRVHVPRLSLNDMFDDAFTAIARDGAGTVEVGIRLQKALRSLAAIGDLEMTAIAGTHSKAAMQRAGHALQLDADIERLSGAAAWNGSKPA
jgi:uncharacterized membrane protein